ncbi:SPOR domain-containing protein [Endothiovibrio diazotrophicus]
MADHNYQFTITRGSMTLLVIALATAGGALFLGGVTLGYSQSNDRLDVLERNLATRLTAQPHPTPPPKAMAPAAPSAPAEPDDGESAMEAEAPPAPVEAAPPPAPTEEPAMVAAPTPAAPSAEPAPPMVAEVPPEAPAAEPAEPAAAVAPVAEENAAAPAAVVAGEAGRADETDTAAKAAPGTMIKTPAAAPTPMDAPDTPVYEVQVGLFLGRANAQHLHDRLQRAGYAVRIFTAVGSGERVWHAVRVGSFPDEEAAAAAARRIKETEGLSTLIARHGELS